MVFIKKVFIIIATISIFVGVILGLTINSNNSKTEEIPTDAIRYLNSKYREDFTFIEYLGGTENERNMLVKGYAGECIVTKYYDNSVPDTPLYRDTYMGWKYKKELESTIFNIVTKFDNTCKCYLDINASMFPRNTNISYEALENISSCVLKVYITSNSLWGEDKATELASRLSSAKLNIEFSILITNDVIDMTKFKDTYLSNEYKGKRVGFLVDCSRGLSYFNAE